MAQTSMSERCISGFEDGSAGLPVYLNPGGNAEPGFSGDSKTGEKLDLRTGLADITGRDH